MWLQLTIMYCEISIIYQNISWKFSTLKTQKENGKVVKRLLCWLPWLWWVFSIVHGVEKSRMPLSNWAYMCIKSLGCIFNIYVFNCHVYFNKAGWKMILKKALMYSNIFYKSTCKKDRMLIMFYQWPLWNFVILFFW